MDTSNVILYKMHTNLPMIVAAFGYTAKLTNKNGMHPYFKKWYKNTLKLIMDHIWYKVLQK